MHIGIDVGGTNTDAVLMEAEKVLAAVKHPSTHDVISGINAALQGIRQQYPFNLPDIKAVMIGTTHFTNALVSRTGLTSTAVIRLSLPAGTGIPPMTGWPDRLADALGRNVYQAHGGNEFNGQLISDIRQDELDTIANDLQRKKITAVAIVGTFSPLTSDIEEQVARYLSEKLPDLKISLSHQIGRIGILERENATILNACLLQLAEKTTHAFQTALIASGISAPLYLSQNDGTLMSVEFARQYPIMTFASGPVNSMRGAALLSGLSDCIVVDIGGTTSDIGILVNGFPRAAGNIVEVCGVRTNFRMPDVLSLGIGGGSTVATSPISVGPQSVGYQLTEKALVFGGDTLTPTDLAVAGGLAEIGDKTRTAHLEQGMVVTVLHFIATKIAQSCDMMRTSSDDIPIVLVGGGNILIGNSLPGFNRVVRPQYAEVANAVGAAIAQMGGEVDRVVRLEGRERNEVLKEVKDEAINRALRSGATPGTVKIVDLDEIPISYLPGNCIRLRVKAVGDLDFSGIKAD